MHSGIPQNPSRFSKISAHHDCNKTSVEMRWSQHRRPRLRGRTWFARHFHCGLLFSPVCFVDDLVSVSRLDPQFQPRLPLDRALFLGLSNRRCLMRGSIEFRYLTRFQSSSHPKKAGGRSDPRCNRLPCRRYLAKKAASSEAGISTEQYF